MAPGLGGRAASCSPARFAHSRPRVAQVVVAVSCLVTIVAGLVMAGVAILAAYAGGWGMPVWSLPALGLSGTVGFILVWLAGGTG